MLLVVANRLPTLMLAPMPNRMPSGLTRKILPFEYSVPRICEGPCPPVTRSSWVELEFGIKIFVVSPEPMLKVCQLMMAFWLD